MNGEQKRIFTAIPEMPDS